MVTHPCLACNHQEISMQLLHIDSAITGEQSVSRELTKRIVVAWKASYPHTTVAYLDLAAQAPAHFSADAMGFRTGQEASTDGQRAENAVSEALVSQFLAADVIVVGAPLYNFTIPSQLKAWVDRIAQTGRTFTYTDKGPVGLAGGKTVIVASSRGGMYSTSEGGQAMEHQESYLKVIFGFMGVTDISIIRAEGLGMGEDARTSAIGQAKQLIEQLSPELSAA